MSDYKKLDMQELLEILTVHTELYTKLLAEKNYTPEFQESKTIIKQIQEEINTKRKTDPGVAGTAVN